MAFPLLKRGLFSSSVKIVEKNAFGTLGVLNNSLDFETKKVHKFSTSRTSQQKYHIPLTTTINNNLTIFKLKPKLLTSREFSSKKSSKSKVDRDYDSDSDSDGESEKSRQPKKGHQERGDSEFWRRKMRTLHGILDINNDGVVSFDDLMLLAKKFTDLGHLPPATSAEFLEVMKKTWEEQWGEITPYNLVTAEQFLTDMHHSLNDKELVKKVGRFLPYFFQAVDTDHSGYLDLNQFKLFFNCLGLTDENAAVAFAVIDKNGDGKLTLKEFVKLGRQYFLTEDERKVSRMLWGPLMNH